ncbi:MAG TPA: hypothetical protein VJL38_01375 [Patescibacteria group bacterium]|nr:hypothetical protein [Patescibacteria group bacterium]
MKRQKKMRAEKRESRKKPLMPVSGKSVFTLKRIIERKTAKKNNGEMSV